MGLFRKKPWPALASKNWTPELWRDVSAYSGSFSTGVAVRLMQKRRSSHCDRRLYGETTFSGLIAERIVAKITFDTSESPESHFLPQMRVGPQVGYVMTQDGTDGYEPDPPCLYIKVWIDEAGAREFEEAFMRAVVAKTKSLPVWIGSEESVPVPSEKKFQIVQPITRFGYGQRIGLARKFSQSL